MLNRTALLIFASVLLSVAVMAQATNQAVDSKAYANDVNRIIAGANSVERGKGIQESLKKSGIEFKTEDFAAQTRSGREVKGTNVIATLPASAAKQTIMIGA